MAEQQEPLVSGSALRESVGESLELITDDAVLAFQNAIDDRALWQQAQDDPGGFLRERGVDVPDVVDVALVDIAGGMQGDRWPGRRCFRVCRRIGPRPPDPDPTVLIHCVEICLPWG